MAVRHDKCRAPSLFLLLSACRSLAICRGRAADLQRRASDAASNSGIQPARLTGVHHGTEFGDAR
jgi:hypothetical protein